MYIVVSGQRSEHVDVNERDSQPVKRARDLCIRSERGDPSKRISCEHPGEVMGPEQRNSRSHSRRYLERKYDCKSATKSSGTDYAVNTIVAFEWSSADPTRRFFPTGLPGTKEDFEERYATIVAILSVDSFE